MTVHDIRALNLHPTFTYDHPELPFTIGANEVARIHVTYSPDAVGLNTGALEIHTDDRPNPTKVVNLSGEAQPPMLQDAGLHLRLDWDSQGDIDIHLIAPGGQMWDQMDCHWANPSPEWGDPNDNLDNPFLDVDNTEAYGPENINVNNPQPGVYQILIHYFANWSFDTDVVNSTVT